MVKYYFRFCKIKDKIYEILVDDKEKLFEFNFSKYDIVFMKI